MSADKSYIGPVYIEMEPRSLHFDSGHMRDTESLRYIVLYGSTWRLSSSVSNSVQQQNHINLDWTLLYHCLPIHRDPWGLFTHKFTLNRAWMNNCINFPWGIITLLCPNFTSLGHNECSYLSMSEPDAVSANLCKRGPWWSGFPEFEALLQRSSLFWINLNVVFEGGSLDFKWLYYTSMIIESGTKPVIWAGIVKGFGMTWLLLSPC